MTPLNFALVVPYMQFGCYLLGDTDYSNIRMTEIMAKMNEGFISGISSLAWRFSCAIFAWVCDSIFHY